MTEGRPLSVAISGLIKEGKILLIKRVRGDYQGLWGLPGGKVEGDEHLSEAAVREISEETGLDSEFEKHMGIVSEHLVEEDEIKKHMLLHICKLHPGDGDAEEKSEGKVRWFDIDNLEKSKDEIIPSDYYMIHEIIDNPEINYSNCILEKEGDDYKLAKWNKK